MKPAARKIKRRPTPKPSPVEAKIAKFLGRLYPDAPSVVVQRVAAQSVRSLEIFNLSEPLEGSDESTD